MSIANVTVNAEQLEQLCLKVMPTGKAMGVEGPPGCAKSAIGFGLAEKFSKLTGNHYKVCQFNAALHEPVEVGGIPYVKNGEMHMALSSFWPREPNNVVVIEEVTKSVPLIQNAIGQLIHDRRLGDYTVPDNTYFYLSWNRSTDFAGDQKLLSHFVNRVMRLVMRPDPEVTINYAMTKGWHVHLIAFLNQFKQMVFDENTFKPGGSKYKAENPCFASPRSWEAVSRSVLEIDLPEDLKIAAMCGLVGEGPTREFIAFEQLMNELIPIELCIKNPKTAPLPKDMAVMYAQTLSLSYAADEKNLKSIVEYIQRMKKEYQILWIKSLSRRSPETISVCEKDIMKWIKGLVELIMP